MAAAPKNPPGRKRVPVRVSPQASPPAQVVAPPFPTVHEVSVAFTPDEHDRLRALADERAMDVETLVAYLVSLGLAQLTAPPPKEPVRP